MEPGRLTFDFSILGSVTVDDGEFSTTVEGETGEFLELVHNSIVTRHLQIDSYLSKFSEFAGIGEDLFLNVVYQSKEIVSPENGVR